MDADARIIRAAIETEIDGYRYFLEAAAKAAHPRAQEVWLSLAGDEVEHMRILQGHLAAQIRGGGWGPAEDGAADEPLPETAPISRPGRPRPAGSDSDLDALEAGLKVEDSTYRFYADAAGRCADPAGRKTYQQLARMEMGHYRLIEETIDLLADPTAWQFRQVSPIQEG